MCKKTVFFIVSLFIAQSTFSQTYIGDASAPQEELSLWFRRPAAKWEGEVLPLGNGFIGASVFGAVAQEQIQINEHTLWSGGPGEKKDYTGGNVTSSLVSQLKKVQDLLADKKSLDANNSEIKKLVGVRSGFGGYQNFGDLLISFSGSSEIHNYRRDLNLKKAVASVNYTLSGTDYFREYFCSLPDSVFVGRIYSNKKGSLNCKVSFKNAHNATTSYKDGIITNRGTLGNKMIFESQTAILLSGGSVSWSASSAEVKSADTLIIIFATGTDYENVFPGYKGKDPHDRLAQIITNAKKKNYQTLFNNHVSDYNSQFDRMSLNIGQTKSSVPTDKLLSSYNGDSRILEAIYFQFGRYLLIASSRPGSLPANLQGIWNNSNSPPWSADYHTNINVQMNYWPAEMTNLSECHLPLIEYTDKLRERGRQTANMHYGCKGWVTHHENNIFGHTGPGDYPYAFFFPDAAAWLCQHLWDHYDFTRDTDYLSKKAYPIIKEVAQFWVDFLIADKTDSKLVVSPSYSPEHGNYTAGCSMSQQIVWDLLTNTLAAAKALNINDEFTKNVQDKLKKLDPGLRIGKWGQLQEWKQDMDSKTDQHRHVSHLFCLHPGKQISPLTTKNYADAARVSLTARGDGGTGWSKAWKINFWARLFNGNHSHKMLKEQLKQSTLPNLWDTHPPFQIDGNFGATSGMGEMLLQSHAGFVHVLPALPDVWKSKGSVKGMCARGGFELNFSWSNGKITECLVKSNAGTPCEIRNGTAIVKFNTVAGGTYSVDFEKQSVGIHGSLPLHSVMNPVFSIVKTNGGKIVTVDLGQSASFRYIINVFDLCGRQILTKELLSDAKICTLDLSRQTHGIFLVRVKDGNDQIFARAIQF